MQLQHFPFTISFHLAARLKLNLPILLLPLIIWWHPPLSAQTFVKITDAGNPIVSDAGAAPNSYTGCSWVDYDNDGQLDLFVNQKILYRNLGSGNFARDNTAITNQGSSFGNSWADVDNDGDLDCFIVGGAPSGSFLYRNDLSNGNRWINILCKGTVSNRAAIGAKVRVKATINGVAIWQMREISSQNCFNGHNMLNAHFGFGNAATIDSLKIEWPSGKVDVLKAVATNQFLSVTEGSSPTGVNENKVQTPQGFGLEQNYPNPFNPATKIRYHLSSRQFVTLKVYNIQGREILTLVNSAQNAGAHEIRFEASQLATSGVYFFQLLAGNFSRTRKMVLAR